MNLFLVLPLTFCQSTINKHTKGEECTLEKSYKSIVEVFSKSTMRFFISKVKEVQSE